MRTLYGRAYNERFRSVEGMIKAGSSVVDVCCGPSTLYHKFLKAKGVHYIGLDINRNFVQRLRNEGGTGHIWDLSESRPLPRADYVVMQGSLYHFLPEPAGVIDRMIAAARKQVLIAEPIKNLAGSQNSFLAVIAGKLTDPGTGIQPNRFSGAQLDETMEPYRIRGHDVQSRLIAGGREKLYIICVKEGEVAEASNA